MLESKKRKISRNNNQGGKEDRPRNFSCTAQYGFFCQDFVRILLAFFQHRFHHHDRPIDQDTEVDRPQRQQVGRNIGNMHQDKSDQQG